jgi:DNA polymerase III epsilon subunit-like protein
MTTQQDLKLFTAIGLDFETGGLDCRKNGCTQIALQAVRLDTWKLIDRYTTYIAPYYRRETGDKTARRVLKTHREMEREKEGVPMEYEQAALTYSGITMDTLINRGIDVRKAAEDILSFASRNTLTKSAQCKPVLIGHNITFDIGFLQQVMNYAGRAGEFEKAFAGHPDFYGHFQPHYIDTIQLAKLLFAGERPVTSYKLELIAAHLGLELDDAHNADADVTTTLDIVRLCSLRLRNQSGGGETGIVKKEKTRAHFKI